MLTFFTNVYITLLEGWTPDVIELLHYLVHSMDDSNLFQLPKFYRLHPHIIDVHLLVFKITHHEVHDLESARTLTFLLAGKIAFYHISNLVVQYLH